MKQGKSSGSDYELGGIHSDYCFHRFVKYDTVTKRNGIIRSLRIGQACAGLLSLRLPSTLVTHLLRMYWYYLTRIRLYCMLKENCDTS